tara:strand:+ start:4370 stop:5380 length:1011 start_codon:yes stop_codon:yes gene_type:complete
VKKNILITGITGMVGSHLADYILNNTDLNIIGVCRWRSPLDNISHLLDLANENKRLKFAYADLNDYLSLQKVFKQNKVDYVSHLAAQSFPRTSFDIPIETYTTNIIGTVNLLEAIKNSNSDPVIHVCSSSEVFGRVPKENVPINEECKFHPASPYAISKIGTDLVGKYYAEAEGLKTIITRMFTHTGPRRGDVFAESTFAKQIAILEKTNAAGSVKVGNLDSLRTFADVRDAVEAYYLLLTSKNVDYGEAFNIGGSYTCTVEDMLNYLISLSTNKNITIEVDPERLRPIDADLQVPDITKFLNTIDWKPKYSFEETMKDLLDYWRERTKNNNFLIR